MGMGRDDDGQDCQDGDGPGWTIFARMDRIVGMGMGLDGQDCPDGDGRGCTVGGNILEKNQIFFCCTQISMWLYILRHLVKELVNLSQYISPNRHLKISKSPYNRKKIFLAI